MLAVMIDETSALSINELAELHLRRLGLFVTSLKVTAALLLFSSNI